MLLPILFRLCGFFSILLLLFLSEVVIEVLELVFCVPTYLPTYYLWAGMGG